MNFGELNDNIIKELIFLFQISWAGVYLYIILYIGPCIKESNKREIIIENEAYCEGKQETSVHAILSIGFDSRLGTCEL